MFIIRPNAGEPIAIYGEDGRLLGTVKLVLAAAGRGKTGLAFDFPRHIRIDKDFGQVRKPVMAASESFGDYDPPDYSVPMDADN